MNKEFVSCIIVIVSASILGITVNALMYNQLTLIA
jgi:hypothetical protein